jgi:2'-5' RNA ligase
MTGQLPNTGWADLQVQALVALLDEQYTTRVKDIWSLLFVECGLNAVNIAPYPHFSFHGAERYDLQEMDARLTELTRTIPPFTIRTTGLGMFTGKNPVVFMPIRLDKTLLDIHQTLWVRTSSLGLRLNEHYRPGVWVPHITLAIHDVTPENIDCVARKLIDRNLTWEIPILKVAMVCIEDGVADIEGVYPLQG